MTDQPKSTPSTDRARAKVKPGESLFATGVGVCALCLLVGGVLGFALPAYTSSDGSAFLEATLTNYLVTTDAGTGSFNWLFFALFACAGIVCLAVFWAAAQIVDHLGGPR